ncbi:MULTISPECIES: hypothetical protein [Bradyrhizobium]|jgi:hypothetical protein|uniref:hypothetical protein n=1 Tax=Bradyrhizobium TaxID=374 RepID=UPI00155E8AFE|nr:MULTISPECIES: hypothetical protein [Bradyrhizobium]MDD1520769.1 hypothetical protein [Bradyrhizobium sp. WBAH30]MDD1545820.1 hypothetical protein [Bradyrhizobium sp. WBAH41]MDD1558919.1 hypothetical protein [Bradyrhizobium sp. WBAH23]MDD1566431.1 hypothetical protein [Bradyrhizobium sp. WBAH33]MDD1592024.1 hypothetical protein [Bradyrhizobium sp. WBAH42]
MKAHLKLAAAVAVRILIATPALAQGQPYLPAQKAAGILADGTPWSADAPNGRSFKLTLNKDGTGSVRATLFTQSVSWTIKGDAMCLSGTMMSKCLRFREIPGGFQAWEGDKPDLKISR